MSVASLAKELGLKLADEALQDGLPAEQVDAVGATSAGRVKSIQGGTVLVAQKKTFEKYFEKVSTRALVPA